jgi:NitT/TauT family transport system ATP-binding protein
MNPKIELQGVSKIYQSAQGVVEAIRDINLCVEEGEFLCILGPSGCGKSTLLRILAGLNRQSSGNIFVNTARNNHRQVNAVVFQEYAIFPWRTVSENVSFGLEMRGVSREVRQERTRKYLAKVGLVQFANHYPFQLSGGMKQRVALARALACDPEILLMDEPLGALDAQTRTIMQEELLRIWEEEKKTVVYVTHSIEEAILLGDRVVLMTARPGRIKSIYPVNLPRPRKLELKTTLEYNFLAEQLWNDLVDEVNQVLAIEKGDGLIHA